MRWLIVRDLFTWKYIRYCMVILNVLLQSGYRIKSWKTMLLHAWRKSRKVSNVRLIRYSVYCFWKSLVYFLPFHGWYRKMAKHTLKNIAVFIPQVCLAIFQDYPWNGYKILSVKRQTCESQNGCYKKTKHAKFSSKQIFLSPWHTHVSDLPFCLITDVIKLI